MFANICDIRPGNFSLIYKGPVWLTIFIPAKWGPPLQSHQPFTEFLRLVNCSWSSEIIKCLCKIRGPCVRLFEINIWEKKTSAISNIYIHRSCFFLFPGSSGWGSCYSDSEALHYYLSSGAVAGMIALFSFFIPSNDIQGLSCVHRCMFTCSISRRPFQSEEMGWLGGDNGPLNPCITAIICLIIWFPLTNSPLRQDVPRGLSWLAWYSSCSFAYLSHMKYW